MQPSRRRSSRPVHVHSYSFPSLNDEFCAQPSATVDALPVPVHIQVYVEPWKGASWAIFGPSWSHLGPRWGHPGPRLGLKSGENARDILQKSLPGGLESHLEGCPSHLWPPALHLDPILGHLGPSWDILGPSWGDLGRCWAILGPSWGLLGALSGVKSGDFAWEVLQKWQDGVAKRMLS